MKFLLLLLLVTFVYTQDSPFCTQRIDRESCLKRCDCGWSAPENSCLFSSNCREADSCEYNTSTSCLFFRVFMTILAIIFLCNMFLLCICIFICVPIYIILLLIKKYKNSSYSIL